MHADLSSDHGWTEAATGVQYVMHVASPFPDVTPQHEDDIIVPARDGTLRVLTAARDAHVERVVLTSSFAAVGYSHKPVPSFTESDWTDPEDDLQPYIKSKVIAERAARDFVAEQGKGLELSVVNPVGIFGSTLSFLAVADGPSISFRDVAVLLRDELGTLAARVPVIEAATSSDGSDSSVVPVISNAKAKGILGWKPRPARDTLLDTAMSLVELGLVGEDEPMSH